MASHRQVQIREDAAWLRRRAVEHEAVIDLVIALQDLGETLWRADERDLAEMTADEVGPEQLADLTELLDDLEQVADDLRDIARSTLRKVRGHIVSQRRLLAEAESLLEYP